MLADLFPGPLEIAAAKGEGTHRTYLLKHADNTFFVRVEDGPENDGHLETESLVMAGVAQTGVPVPRVIFTDASRREAHFAVQVIEYFDCPDLNRLHREGQLPLARTAGEIGRGIARWQAVPVQNFGPFQNIDSTANGANLTGYHSSYATYFHLHLERHLQYLEACEFLAPSEAADIRLLIQKSAHLLALQGSCLVHKDLALWNIMGTAQGIRAYIDWDDAIGGDPTDDLSLLACFHPADVVMAAVRGYESERALPENFLSRFWLHLVRNMIVKAVIRCGAGYFDQTSSNFLMDPAQNGAAFRNFTRERLLAACRGQRENLPLFDL